MNELQKILADKLKEYGSYVTDSYGYYYDVIDDGREPELDDLADRYMEFVDFHSLAKTAAEGAISPEIFKVQMEKKILTDVKASLEESIGRLKSFKAKTNWKPLDQLLTVYRLKELKSVGITRRSGRGKGKSYDISTFAATFFGKQILRGLGMERRRSLKEEELELLKAECAKLKLTLPEVTEPTTTERFFAAAE